MDPARHLFRVRSVPHHHPPASGVPPGLLPDQCDRAVVGDKDDARRECVAERACVPVDGELAGHRVRRIHVDQRRGVDRMELDLELGALRREIEPRMTERLIVCRGGGRHHHEREPGPGRDPSHGTIRANVSDAHVLSHSA